MPFAGSSRMPTQRTHDPRLPEDWALAVRRNAERAAALAEPVRRIAQPKSEAPGVDHHRLTGEGTGGSSTT